MACSVRIVKNLTRPLLEHQSSRHLTIGSNVVGQKCQPQEEPNGANVSSTRPTTNQMDFMEPTNVPVVAAYRVLSPEGSLVGSLDSTLSEDKMVHLYSGMVRLNVMDKILFDCQRQGRISFYMTNFGEEAAQFGSAGAVEATDLVFAQYREAGVLLHRGMSARTMLAQCYGTKEDLGQGRQMPIHYGNRELNFVTLSSPLATQLPQAAGSAYAFKLDKSSRVVVCYFGEGAASEGDAHAAMNFAATLSCPVIFFCRNNGYAISTPTQEQYRGDGIVHRGLGYGMAAIRVDGNDLFAVYGATRAARQLCLDQSRPVLIEAMTYRVGHHSTSDDSLAYRSLDEVRHWETNDSAIKRVQRYLLSSGLWSDAKQRELEQEARAQVLDALSHAEKTKKPSIESMFDDVYDKLPANLIAQREELKRHLQKYGHHYSVEDYDDTSV